MIGISVIIPTFKPKEYIVPCLESLSRQDLSSESFEIIIVLNGCEEPWKSQIEKIISDIDLKNATLICVAKGGVSNARNVGLAKARGRNIAFIDDDYVSETYLSGLLKNVSPNSVALSNSVAFLDGTNGFMENYAMRTTYYKFKNVLTPSLAQVRSILNGPCMKLIPRDVIVDSRFDESFKNGEDGLFMFEISKNIKHVKFAPESSVYFRRFRSDSAVTSRKSTSYIMLNACRLILAVLKRYMRSPKSYNLKFTITRILGPVKGAVYEILKS